MKNKFELYRLYPKGAIFIIVPIVSILLAVIFKVLGGEYNGAWQLFFIALLPTIIIWSGCYFIVQLLWKHFPWEKHPILHLVFEITLISLYLILYFSFMLYLAYGTDVGLWTKMISKKGLEIFNTFLITFLITTIHEGYYFYKQWIENFSKSVSLEKDNLQAQYNALKAQINPHFLFNSLNSLMTLIEGNPKAEKYVQDLSEFLRFVLQSSEKETVSLNEELNHLEKYFNLMQLRFGTNLSLEMDIRPEDTERQLPPLVLQILAENAIQHNIITQQKPLHIKIFTHDDLITVQNNLQKKANSASTGQGLNNIRGRYRFHHPDEMKICETENEFVVTVPLI